MRPIEAEIAALAKDDREPRARGTEPAVRAKGLLRSEGKGYVVQDGDVIHFRFNV